MLFLPATSTSTYEDVDFYCGAHFKNLLLKMVATVMTVEFDTIHHYSSLEASAEACLYKIYNLFAVCNILFAICFEFPVHNVTQLILTHQVQTRSVLYWYLELFSIGLYICPNLFEFQNKVLPILISIEI